MEKKPTLRDIAEARAIIRQEMLPRPRVRLPLDKVLGCVTAEPLLASGDSPAFDQSAQDGYALAALETGPHPLWPKDRTPGV